MSRPLCTVYVILLSKMLWLDSLQCKIQSRATYDLGVAVTGGLNATPESFFPTLPSLSLLVEDAAEGFSSLFSRTSPDMPGAGDLEDSRRGAQSTPLHEVSVWFMICTCMRLSSSHWACRQYRN